jgi:hypothetical protein
MISNQEIIFAPADALTPSMNAVIVLDWPCLRDSQVRLQLMLGVTITGIHDGVAEARIVTYAFRADDAEELGRES